jgi:hypothetical protein
VPLKILEPDGSVTDAVNDLPHSFLPDGTGMRVRMRFIQSVEALATYDGLRAKHASYTAVKTAYAMYSLIPQDTTLGLTVDFDITCMVAGVQVQTGRSGLFEDIEAGTTTVSIIDPLGIFDPRSTDTSFGPGRRVRSGTWVRVELYRAGAWVALFTGLTDKWDRRVPADAEPEVSVNATDFFASLATARVNTTLAEATTSVRTTTLANLTWSTLWGVTRIAVGTTVLFATTVTDGISLDLMRAAAAVEDGRVYIAADGALVFENGTWRSNRVSKVVALGPGAPEYEGQVTVCTYASIALGFENYTALKTYFLVYADMKLCATAGGVTPRPTVCATALTITDESDDVVNEVVLEWGPENAIVGYVTGTGDVVRSNTPPKEIHSARDPESVARFGVRQKKRSDLQPKVSTVLDALAVKMLDRWKYAEATVSALTIDLNAERDATTLLASMKSGDLMQVVDKIPAHDVEPEQWTVTTAEVMGMTWNLTPSTFALDLTLDEVVAQ